MTATQLLLTTAAATLVALGYGLHRRSRTTYHRRDSWQAPRPLYLSAGFAVALGLVSAAFEYTTHERVAATAPIPASPLGEVAVVPRTAPPAPALPPPPPAPDPRTAELLTVEDLPEPRPFEDEPVELPRPGPRPGAGAAVAPPSSFPAPPPPVAPAPPPPPVNDEPISFAERMPMFPGCEDVDDYAERRACAERRMLEYLYEEVSYPALAKENGVQGKALLQFTVEKDGSISGVEVVRGPQAGIDAEARRVVEGFPRWEPGRQGGRPVRVRFTLPIDFRLE